MNSRSVWWLAIPAIVGVVSYLAASGQFQRICPSIFLNAPVVEYPATLDLGDHEEGDQVITHYKIANRGGRELVIDNIRTNCSCTGIEREQEGHYLRFESLRLKPGEEEYLVMRISVRGVPAGAQMVNVIEFATNDPTEPTGRIEALVRYVYRGVTCDPPRIIFGTVPSGYKVKQIIDVRDTAVPPRVIQQLNSSQPNRLCARLIPFDGSLNKGQAREDGTVIGRMEVTVNTGNPGDLDASIDIHVSGERKRPTPLPVIGRIVPPIEMTPSLVILPRKSGAGLLYEGESVFRTTNGKALKLAVDHVPPNLSVNVEEGENESTRIVRVRWQAKQKKTEANGQRQGIRLIATVENIKVPLELPILLED